MTDTPASRVVEDRPSRGAVQAELTADAAAKRGRSSDLRPLTRLVPYIQRRPKDVAAAAIFLILAAAATLALPVAARALVDRGFATATLEAVNQWFLLLVGVALCMAVFSASRFYFVTKLGERVVADLRADVYDRVIGLSPSYFARVRTGEALSRLTVDATLIESLVGSSASIAIRNLVMLAGGISMMVVTSLKLTFMVVLIIPLVLVPLFTIGRRVRTLSTSAQDRVAEAAAEASESLDAVETKDSNPSSSPINRFGIGKINVEDLSFTGEGEYRYPVIECIDGQLITNKLSLQPLHRNGSWCSDTSNDVLKIVVVNRYHQAPIAKAFIHRFGLTTGAIASSVAHDSHNIVAVGVDDESLCRAINLVIETKGGVSCVGPDMEHCLPLPIGGLMSAEDGYAVAAAYTAIDKAAKSLGSTLSAPFMSLSFMALLVIPSLKLSDKGLFDGEAFGFYQ
jgi:hypothetical protein